MSKIENTIQSAIKRSISHTESVNITVSSWDAALPVLKEAAGELELDWCELEAGRYDVWAFAVDAPEGVMAWRITVQVEPAWTFDGYWNAVLGPGCAAQVVFEFDLAGGSRRDLDEWLGHSEEEAAMAGGIEIPESWEDFHARALDALVLEADS